MGPDEDVMACGCTDYHMADCPILTDRFAPSEPDIDSWYEDEGRGDWYEDEEV